VGLQAQRLFVLHREAAVDQHRLAGDRIEGLVGEPVVRAVPDERDEDQDPRIETAARPRRPALPWPPAAERILAHVPLPALQRSRATRKPTRALVLSTGDGARQELRVCCGELAQAPPRTTCMRQPGLTQAAPEAGARR